MASVVDQSAHVWRGPGLPTHLQGLNIRWSSVQRHQMLLERIPLVPDVQSAVASCICQGQLHDEGCQARQQDRFSRPTTLASESAPLAQDGEKKNFSPLPMVLGAGVTGWVAVLEVGS